jgi:hypothetical protein
MQTLISVFQDRRAAQRAVDSLLDEGFEPDDVHLQEGAHPANIAVASSPAGTPTTSRTEPDRGVLSSIGHFFVSLFDQDPSSAYPDRYSEAIRRGHPVVVIDARNEEEVDRACAILREHGAADIDQLLLEWRNIEAGTASSTGVVMGTGQQMQAAPAERRGVHLVQRDAGRPLRDMVRERRAGGERRHVTNRPASTEGESRGIDRRERERRGTDRRQQERAMAAEPPRQTSSRENDLEAREKK